MNETQFMCRAEQKGKKRLLKVRKHVFVINSFLGLKKLYH